MKRRALTTTASIISLCILAGPSAMAQVQAVPAGVTQPAPLGTTQTSQRLDRMEAALRDLQGVVYSVENPRPKVPVQSDVSLSGRPISSTIPTAAPSEAALSVRITALEQSLSALTGDVERMMFKLDQQGRRLDQLTAVDGPTFGVGSSLPAIEGAVNTSPTMGQGGATQTGAPMDLSTGEVATTTLPDDPDAAYDVAYTSVLSADYDAAEKNLAAFVEKFPEAPQTPEAKFLLGEVYLATGANGDAARVFLDHVGAYKDNPRSPEAYLKLGISFSRLGRTDEACKVFKAGKTKFKDMADPLRRRYEAEQGEASCS